MALKEIAEEFKESEVLAVGQNVAIVNRHRFLHNVENGKITVAKIVKAHPIKGSNGSCDKVLWEARQKNGQVYRGYDIEQTLQTGTPYVVLSLKTITDILRKQRENRLRQYLALNEMIADCKKVTVD